jgi:hypothetical protein
MTAFFESFTNSLRQKWLQFFQSNRDWIVLHMQVESVYTPDGGKRPPSYLILGVLNALEPKLAQLMQPFSKLNPDADTLVEVLDLHFDPDMVLGHNALSEPETETDAEPIALASSTISQATVEKEKEETGVSFIEQTDHKSLNFSNSISETSTPETAISETASFTDGLSEASDFGDISAFDNSNSLVEKPLDSQMLALDDSQNETLVVVDSFAQDSFGQDSFAQDSFGQDSFGQDSFAQDSFAQDSFAQDSFGQDSFGQDSFAQDSFAQDSFGQDSFAQDSFGQDNLGEMSFAAIAEPEVFTETHKDNGLSQKTLLVEAKAANQEVTTDDFGDFGDISFDEELETEISTPTASQEVKFEMVGDMSSFGDETFGNETFSNVMADVWAGEDQRTKSDDGFSGEEASEIAKLFPDT